jgi:hypothetical protein
MTKSDLLTSIINQKISEIIGMNQSAESILNSLLHNDLHLDGAGMTCSFDGRFLVFTSDFVERQSDLDTRIEIHEAIEFIKNTLNQIYQNEQIQAQLI